MYNVWEKKNVYKNTVYQTIFVMNCKWVSEVE